MAKEIYVSPNGVARRAKNIYIGINNVARKVSKAYIGVNGVARLCYSAGPTPEELEIEAALIDFTYTKRSDGMYELTGWNGTLNGEPSTICKVPDYSRILI